MDISMTFLCRYCPTPGLDSDTNGTYTSNSLVLKAPPFPNIDFLTVLCAALGLAPLSK